MRHVITRSARDLFAAHYINRRGQHAARAIEEQICEVGLVTLDGLDSRDAVLDFASRHLSLIAHRDSEPDGLTIIHDTGRHAHQAGFGGLGRGALNPHTHRSSLAVPPRLMLFACIRPAEEGGLCLLTDGRAVHVDLQMSQPDAAAALAEKHAAFFGSGDGVFAPVFDWPTEGRISIRLRQDGLVRWHVFVQPYVPHLRAAIARHQQPLALDAGDGYLLDNHRWLHACTHFRGQRRCYRALGDPRFPLPSGFTPQQVAAVPFAPLETC
ncbi:TauD/TfdA family dioxygenase [Streptomyces sp. RPT161]|uniref:TauD/TfdA family dioxygenase n=1 Tax=Streptomyces sp. RPT161 TaxID=3015993 RepID=UPI0022B92B1F|nr:TauD/TfdA family dioxygenase [Streptomyces sp. RPT161]